MKLICLVSSEWRRWWGWWRSNLLRGIQRLRLWLALPPPSHWRKGCAGHASLPASHPGRPMRSSDITQQPHLPPEGAGPDGAFVTCMFPFLLSVGFIRWTFQMGGDGVFVLFFPFLEQGQGLLVISYSWGRSQFSLQSAICLRKLLTNKCTFSHFCCLISSWLQTQHDITVTTIISPRSDLMVSTYLWVKLQHELKQKPHRVRSSFRFYRHLN